MIQSLDDARTNAITGRSAATIHVPFRESKLTRLLQPYFVDGYVVSRVRWGERERWDVIQTIAYYFFINTAKYYPLFQKSLIVHVDPANLTDTIQSLNFSGQCSRIEKSVMDRVNSYKIPGTPLSKSYHLLSLL